MKINRKTILEDEEYLRQISYPIDLDKDDFKEEVKALEDFCSDTECFALAAVQIGIPKRMVYLKNTTLDVPLEEMAYNEAKVLINPEIIEREGLTTYWEACLSCLDYMGLVKRPYRMKIKYYDIDGISHEEEFIGFPATVLSHELDHLDGILHMDIAEEVRDMPRDKRKEFRETHPYEIISKTGEYSSPKKLVK